jgi:hypothetical protein
LGASVGTGISAFDRLIAAIATMERNAATVAARKYDFEENTFIRN